MGNILPLAISSIDTKGNVITITTNNGQTSTVTIPPGPPGLTISDIGVTPDGGSIVLTRSDGKPFAFPLPAGRVGNGIAKIEQSADGASMRITYTDQTQTTIALPPGQIGQQGVPGVSVKDIISDGTTMSLLLDNGKTTSAIKLPVGPQGLQGITGLGIKSIVPGKDGATLIVTLTDNSTSTLNLPPGTQSDNITNISVDSTGNLILTTVYGKTFTVKMPLGITKLSQPPNDTSVVNVSLSDGTTQTIKLPIPPTYIPSNNFDFNLGNNDQKSRGDTGPSRALVKDNSGVLAINYGGDFSGGVRVDSNVGINGNVFQSWGPTKSIRQTRNMFKCLDNAGGTLANGNKIQTSSCTNDWNQQWVYGTDGTIRPIKNKGYCLDVPGGNFNAKQPLQLYQCNGGNAQNFTYNPSTKQFISIGNSTYCLDTGNPDTTGVVPDNQAITIFPCDPTNNNQKFELY